MGYQSQSVPPGWRTTASELELSCVAAAPLFRISRIKPGTLLGGVHEGLAPHSDRTRTNLHSRRRVSRYANEFGGGHGDAGVVVGVGDASEPISMSRPIRLRGLSLCEGCVSGADKCVKRRAGTRDMRESRTEVPYNERHNV
jgi:hypothetical protein